MICRIVHREIAATAQVHGGTRVIELTVRRVGDGRHAEHRMMLVAYDSQQLHDAWNLLFRTWNGEIDQECLSAAREAAHDLLAPDPEESDTCGCWARWDPHCGRQGCWGGGDVA